jgi:hypothetical protein
MEECIHEVVCRHKGEGEEERCSSAAICKFYDNGSFGPAEGKTAHRKKRRCNPMARTVTGPLKDAPEGDDEKEPKISKKELMRAYGIVKRRMKEGRLTENQALAMKALKGKHFKSMTEEQKQQIIDIADTPLKEAKDV